MPRFARFLWLLFTLGFKRGQVIVKVVTLAVAGLLGYAFWNTSLMMVLTNQAYSFSVGGVIATGIIVLAITFRAGEAWRESGVAELSFGDIHYESSSNSFWLEIRNQGYIDSGTVKVWLSRAFNSDESEVGKISLPILIETPTHGVIARGHSTVKIGTVTLVEKFFPSLSICGTDTGGHDKGIIFNFNGFEWADTANRIYINLSISHASRRLDAWYELQTMSSTSPHIAFAAVKHPLTKAYIRKQRAKLGIPPDSPSLELTTRADGCPLRSQE